MNATLEDLNDLLLKTATNKPVAFTVADFDRLLEKNAATVRAELKKYKRRLKEERDLIMQIPDEAVRARQLSNHEKIARREERQLIDARREKMVHRLVPIRPSGRHREITAGVRPEPVAQPKRRREAPRPAVPSPNLTNLRLVDRPSESKQNRERDAARWRAKARGPSVVSPGAANHEPWTD